MVAEKLSTNDIRGIGVGGVLEVTLPDYKACMSAKNLVTYTKNMYPREDGMTYTCSIDSATNTISIKVVKPEDVNRKNKQNI
ncbi:MAG: hypothetical protein IKX61_00075 [Prevotella sp.]|nr:hypothetical protein [Prevotella sp.]